MNQNTPRAKRQQRTYEAILTAARQLIHEKGIDGLSMRAIAEQIEYSPAAIYEYFGSKEEIITSICAQGHLRLRDYMARVPADLPFADYFLDIGLAYIEFAVQNPDFFLLMFTTTPISEQNQLTVAAWCTSEQENESSSFPILLRAVERGVTEGVFTLDADLGVGEMAIAAWTMVHGIAMLRITHLKPLAADFDTIARETLRAFGRGLALRAKV